MRGVILVLLLCVRAALAAAQPTSAVEPAAQPVMVVLIGAASASTELSEVISELLLRQGVQPQVERRQGFEPDAWLDASPADARAWAFVLVSSPQRAELYFRSPHGERFLLRELALRDGLDEVGRELIARVVETSTVALLHSSEGLSREEARADLARAAREHDAEAARAVSVPVASPAPSPRVRAQPTPADKPGDVSFGVRLLGQLTGSDLGPRIAAGLEAGLALNRSAWPRVRARMSVEAALPQQVDTPEVNARVITLPLRLGLDLGSVYGAYLGLSTGFDVVHVAPEELSAPGLVLSSSSTELVPSSRAELRYELHLASRVWLAFSALADMPWSATHYDVIEAGRIKRVATQWPVQPGVGLTLLMMP